MLKYRSLPVCIPRVVVLCSGFFVVRFILLCANTVNDAIVRYDSKSVQNNILLDRRILIQNNGIFYRLLLKFRNIFVPRGTKGCIAVLVMRSSVPRGTLEPSPLRMAIWEWRGVLRGLFIP